jgi:putative mRNA 3-end processing factor
MNVIENKGLLIDSGSKLLIDGNSNDFPVILTHAHSDHAKPRKNKEYYCSFETTALLEKKFPESKFNSIPFKKNFFLNDLNVSFHFSGHILGSSQIKIEHEKSLLITSDFNLHKSILFEPAEIISTDILVIESTFGLSKFVFPLREKVYEEMIHWINSEIKKNNFVILGGYATGKAQELTAISSLLCDEIPLVFKSIYENNKIYELMGINLGKFIELNYNLNESNVLILPPQLINSGMIESVKKAVKKNVSVAVASGWNNSRYKNFLLSDHADFNQLIKYIKEANPKKVITYHGFSRELAGFINRRLGIPAQALGKHFQMDLNGFF